jgi:hypothetical protein
VTALEALLGSALAGTIFCAKVAGLLLPALVLYEVAAPLPVFARWGKRLGGGLSRFGMSPPCTVPLAAGFFLGIAYGAGVIIPIAVAGAIGAAEIQSVAFFLCTCHAIVEDTLLFAIVGAPGLAEVARRMAILVGVRLVLAIGLTAARARLLRGRAPQL